MLHLREGWCCGGRRVRSRWLDRLATWFIPINLRLVLQTQGAVDSIVAFSLTLSFLCETARPGTFTSRDDLRHMTQSELQRYLAFYLWYAFMYLAQMTASLLLYMDVRNVRYSVDGRRRTILAFLIFSPTLWANLILSAANVMYFPWAPLGLLYVLHALFLAPYWLYAFRYHQWLGDGELVYFESPLVGAGATGTAGTELVCDPGPSCSTVVGAFEVVRRSGSGPRTPTPTPTPPPPAAVPEARLISLEE